MAKEFVNRLEVSGATDAVEAFLAKVSPDGDSPGIEQMLPSPDGLEGSAREAWERANWGAPGSEPSDHQVSALNGDASNAEFSFTTLRHAPTALAGKLAEAYPDLVFALASVDPTNETAEIVVHGAGQSYSYELGQEELVECGAGTDFDEGGAMDDLFATVESVVDDYRNALRSPAP